MIDLADHDAAGFPTSVLCEVGDHVAPSTRPVRRGGEELKACQACALPLEPLEDEDGIDGPHDRAWSAAMAGDARLRASSARRARDLATHGTVRALAVAHEEGIAALLALDEAGRFSAEERSAVWPLLHTLTLAVVGATRDLEDLARQVAEEAYR